MSNKLHSPPQLPVCLSESYKSRGVKGGTVIAEDVLDRETHRQKLLDPDDYRAYIGVCWNCGCTKVYAHCFRCRILYPAQPDDEVEEAEVRLYRCCPKKGCGAVYTVLPAFVARHLWRDWQTVEDVCKGRKQAPPRTERRWRCRLAHSARRLLELFDTTVVERVKDIVSGVWGRIFPEGLTTGEFIETFRLSEVVSPGFTFARIAAWIHRVAPGVRIM